MTALDTELRSMTADEISLVEGAAANPWIVRIAVKLIILAADHVGDVYREGGYRSSYERGNKV